MPTQDEIAQNATLSICQGSGCNGITSCYDVVAGDSMACNPDTTTACRVSYLFSLYGGVSINICILI